MLRTIQLRRLVDATWRRTSSWARHSSTSIPMEKINGPAVSAAHLYKEPPLESWCGADVNAVVHQSLERMVPCDVVTLPGRVFNAPVRPDLVHRVVIWQLAKRRAGTAKAKNRSEVAGSGRKIRPQKGSGRSRQGAITSPLFRGGGRAHGPVNRDFNFPLPFNIRRNALRSVLTSKFACGQLWIIENAAVMGGRTRNLIDACESYGWKSALIVDDVPDGPAGVDSTLSAASGNIVATLAMNARGLNVYDALSFDMLVLTKSAVDHLRNRFARYEWLV